MEKRSQGQSRIVFDGNLGRETGRNGRRPLSSGDGSCKFLPENLSLFTRLGHLISLTFTSGQ